jgi:hypothetical protein
MTNETNDNPPPPPPVRDDPLDAVLQQQARELDDIFHRFLDRMEIGRSSEDRILVALRAQAQCQATARTLQQWQRQNKTQEKP